MSNVIDMFSKRELQVTPTLEALVVKCIDDISENWQRFAKNNRLNDFFLSCIPHWAIPQINYLSDINAISVIETKLGLSVIVNAPGTSPSSKLGWVAGFQIKDANVETPVMMCEAYARCFNIILFLKLSRELTNHGII